jgi:simple sugar transport system substrate-binding protein
LTSILDEWSGYYVQRAKDVIAGTWQSQSTWWGLKEGMVAMAPYGEAVPEAVRQAADATRDNIIAGTLNPFTGPIKSNKGEDKVAAGQTIGDNDLQKMDWYVAGVEA